MTTLGALVWKEWRDHRVALIAFPLAIAPLIALLVLLLPAGHARDPSLPSLAAFGAYVIAALTLMADLVPGEEQRGTIALLRRLPNGLARVFGAKLLFALLTTAAFCAIAYFVTTILSAALRSGPWFPRLGMFRLPPFQRGFGVGLLEQAFFAGVFLAPAAWMVAVSTWLPRGALALPTAALVLALFGAPIALAFATHPGLLPREGDLVATTIGLALAAPVVAALSFVLGRRRGGGIGASAWRGLLATLLLFAPAYARTAWHVARWDRVDPYDSTFEFVGGGGHSCFVGADGRHAFLTVQHRSWGEAPSHALVVDLADGSWRELGRAGDGFSSTASISRRSALPFVTRTPQGLFGSSFRSAADARTELQRWILIDTTTLATKAAASLAALPDPFRSTPEFAAVERIANSIRLPDGRRVWMRGWELVTDTADGGERALPDSQLARSSWALPLGHGMRLFGSTGAVVYDAIREKRYELSDGIDVLFVRPGRWVVARGIDRASHRERALYDPDSREFTPLPSSIADAEFPALADDGRLIALLHRATDPRRRTVALVDPESGVCEPIELPPWFGGELRAFDVEGRTPGGALVVAIHDADRKLDTCYARLDLAARRLVAAGDGVAPAGLFLAAPDEATLILVAGGRRLVRARFGDARTELLFPRPEARQ